MRSTILGLLDRNEATQGEADPKRSPLVPAKTKDLYCCLVVAEGALNVPPGLVLAAVHPSYFVAVIVLLEQAFLTQVVSMVVVTHFEVQLQVCDFPSTVHGLS